MQLSVKDTARLLSVSEKTVYRWIKQQTIPAYRVGDQYRFNRAELLEWATSRRIPLSPEIFQEEHAAASGLPSVSQALRAGGLAYRVGGHDLAGVLKAVVEVLRLPDEVDRDFLYQVLLARELLGTTALGDGIAIPHVRNPVVLQIVRPQITLCFLERPVDFGALDGQPVSTLFTLISPTVRAHLHLLSHLAHVLQHTELRRALREQGTREEILALVEEAEAGIKTAAV